MGTLVIIYKCYYNARMKYVALKLINFICRGYAQAKIGNYVKV
jgi:spermidine/putrescine-binding protein